MLNVFSATFVIKSHGHAKGKVPTRQSCSIQYADCEGNTIQSALNFRTSQMCEKLRDFAMSSTVTYLKLMLLHQLLETGMSVPTGQIPTQQSVSGNIQCNPGSGIFFLDGATLPCKQRGTSYCHTIIEQEDVQFCLKTCCSKAKKPDAVGPSDKSDSDANRWKEISPKRPTNSSGPTPVERGNI